MEQQNPPPPPPPSEPLNPRSPARIILPLAAAAVAIILALTFAWYELWHRPFAEATHSAKELAGDIRQLFNVTPLVTVNNTVIINESSPILELATVDRVLTTEFEWRHTWLHSEKILKLKGTFRVKGGFDLAQSCALNVQPSPLKLLVKFPEPKLLSLELLTNEIDQFENGWWNKLTPEDHQEAITGLTKAARDTAESSIKADARRNLEDKLRELAQTKGLPITFEYAPVSK